MNPTTSREEAADFTTKQEESNTVDQYHHGKKKYSNSNASSSSTLTPWSRLKDPRIVRVSRASGGKDRHSKVCTVKGLRDRRVRLSVPTAIQLYDLQERLGLSQPSKVVDWLLNEAKHEIDELPPLQMPLNFGQNGQTLIAISDHHGVDFSQSNKGGGLKMTNSVDWDSNFWNSDFTMSDTKSKEAATVERNEEEQGGEEKQVSLEIGPHGANVSPNNFFPRSNSHQSSIPGLLNNVMPYNSFCRWDPSIFSLSHFTPQTEDHHPHQNFNVVPLPWPSPFSLPSSQSHFPSHHGESDPKQMNHFQMLSSSSQNPSLSNSLVTPTGQIYMKPLQLSMASNLHPSQNSSGSQSNNDSGV